MKIIFLIILLATFFCFVTKVITARKKTKAKLLKRDGYTGMYRALKR